MAKTTLGKGAVRAIHDVLDRLFDRLKVRVLGNTWVDKRIKMDVIPELTLSGLFRQASIEERNKPDEDLEQSLLRTADGYLEAQRIAMKTRTVHAVESFLREAEHKGVDTDVETVLGGELGSITRNVTEGVKKIIDTEATHVRNTGTLDGLLKVNAGVGIEDPTVFFIVVRDEDLCEECRRLHLLDDGVTPRVWKLSQIGHGYHKRGEDNPKLGGLHPHCRCSLGTVLPSFGFNDSGMITYIGPNHDEFKKQNGTE